MGRYAQLVIGPAGSGKVCFAAKNVPWVQASVEVQYVALQSTYCDQLRQHCETIGRTVHVVNLGKCSADV